jgi:hypothetical protein
MHHHAAARGLCTLSYSCPHVWRETNMRCIADATGGSCLYDHPYASNPKRPTMDLQVARPLQL